MISEVFEQFLASVADGRNSIVDPMCLHCARILLLLLTHSLVKNLLCTFFKFTSSFVVQLLLFGYGGCTVLRLSPCWHVRRRCAAHLLLLLPIRGVLRLLSHATLVKSLHVVGIKMRTVVGGEMMTYGPPIKENIEDKKISMFHLLSCRRYSGWWHWRCL